MKNKNYESHSLRKVLQWGAMAKSFHGQEPGSPRKNALEAVPWGSRRTEFIISRAMSIYEKDLPNPLRVGKVAVHI